MENESHIEQELLDEIKKAIETGQMIKLRLYGLLAKTEEELNFIITGILGHFGRAELVGAAYTAVKELALNGAKANFKHVLFEELDIDATDLVAYERGMDEFRSKLNEKWVFEYASKCRERDLYVDVNFHFDDTRMAVEVVNWRPLTETEDRRIRDKFREGSQYDSIAEFYMHNMDDSEGAGMGITLILMLLRAEGIDPHSFTIESDFKTSTIAKLEFPLSEDYRSERDEFEEKQA